MTTTLISPQTLAQHWGLKVNTLNKWRWKGQGPKYTKIGLRIRYAWADVRAYERQHRIHPKKQHKKKDTPTPKPGTTKIGLNPYLSPIAYK